MLLARKGHEVLLVDRASFPSDTPKGHFIHMHGPRRLADWGLLERVLGTGCPPVTTATFDLGDFPLTARELSVDDVPLGLGPRRSQLDAMLVRAAVEAGAELRDGFAVQDLIEEDGRVAGVVGRPGKGQPLLEQRCSIVVGADGRNSAVGQHVGARYTEFSPGVSCWYFTYWSGVPREGLEIRVKDGRATFGFPTNDDLFALFVAWPSSELTRVRADIEGEYLAVVDTMPDLAERVRAGRREERFYGATQLPNFIRQAHGEGWALVGDAGVHKDPFMALGCCDALRDADLLADALDEGLSGRLPMEEALEGYEQRRDELTMPWFEINRSAARLQPAPDELALRAALRDSPEDTRQFYLAREGMVPPETFFAEENIGRIMSASGATA